MAYRKVRTHPLAGAALAVAAALAAVGCTSGSPGTSGNAHRGQGGAPAVTTAEASRAFASYAANRVASAYYYDERSLSTTTGVAHAVFSAGNRVLRYYQAQPVSPGFRFSKPVFYLPASAGYPQWFVADVSTTPGRRPSSPPTPAEGAAVPWIGTGGRMLVLFEKTSATTGWQLASESFLAPGTAPPALATDGHGRVPVVPLSDGALLARPDVTGPLQAAVVDDGPASAAAKVVAGGPLTTGLYDTLRTTLLGLSAPAGDQRQWTLEGSRYTPFALRTADGGALVLYAMYLNAKVATPAELSKGVITPGPPITVPPYLAPLLPPGTPAPRVSLQAQQVLSFAAVDPPSGNGKIQVIAIGGGPSYASAS